MVIWQGEPDDVSTFQALTGGSLVCDSLSLVRELSRAVGQLNQTGYLLASYSLEYFQTDTLAIIPYVGERFLWARLNTGSIPEEMLSKSGFRRRDYDDEPYNPKEVKRLFSSLISYSENTGYPFASVYLDSVSIEEKALSAKLIWHAGPRITYDSIKFESPVRIKPSWLAAYLGMTYGTPFSQRDIDAVGARIRELGFVRLNAPPRITFQNRQATVWLDLAPRKVSQIDGIIGFLPNEQEEGRLLITGQFDLSLRNLFGSGKSLDVQWQSLKPRSQLLDIQYEHPGLFHSGLDFLGSFNLLKEDTFFITREGEVNFAWKPADHGISLFSRFRSSSLLSSEGFEDAVELPGSADLNVDYYGVRYEYSSLDAGTFPTSGIRGHLNAAVGSKRIRRNPDLPAELYEGLDLNSVQYIMEAGFNSYWRMGRYLVLHHNLRGARIINDRLFLNDLYRVGGLLTLRGFNENFFFASDYLLSNLEVQFHFQQGSHLFVFYDQSWLYYKVGENRFEDYPSGTGIGLNLSVASGLISLVYALGSSEDQPFSLSLSKFHFGYVAKF